MCKYLRDTNDPFFIPEENFRKMYRLSKEAARDLYLELLPHMDQGRRVTKIPSVVRICDSDLNIMSINARFPGSVHDSAIWMMSGVKQIMRDAYENGDRSSWLLGDSGYPLEPFLLTPIEGANPQTPEGRYTTATKQSEILLKGVLGF
ncbi:putative nuclease HARBI1 [Photinus pyralis]|uniref:putative nuclease HARBI1 n=1 Tax=Photinus pyralis TaxID=7054 RepID=UPI001266F343|nr:putative nuclease HARBI1 [Photinus pyralis]